MALVQGTDSHVAPPQYGSGFKHKSLWFSLAGLIPEPYYGGPIRDEKVFVWNDEIHKLQDIVRDYLYKYKIIPQKELLPGAIDDSLARQAMKEVGVTSPLIVLKAVPLEVGYPLVNDPKRIEDYTNLFRL